jgi:Tfp pilus assembly protein PilF
MDPNFFRAHLILGWAHEPKGQFEEAVAEYKTAVG